MDDYIVKPVTLDQLAEALAKCAPVARASAREAEALDREVLDQLREDLGGTAALLDVIETFLEKTPPVLTALRDAAARADAGGIRQAAHMIKGTSAMLGGRELSEQCAEIERLGRIGGVPDAATRVTAVEAAYRTIEAALKAEIERLRRSERRE